MSAVRRLVKSMTAAAPENRAFCGSPVEVVAIGGFDPTGGAGVVRDFVTGRALGAAVRLVPAAWTEQSVAGVSSVEARDPDRLATAIRTALALPIEWVGRPATAGRTRDQGRAVKIGMLPDAAAALAVRAALADFDGPVVLDPVLAASSGGALYTGDLGALLALATRAMLLTPNALEAAVLTGGGAVRDLVDAARAGGELCRRGAGAVLIKGGHLDGASGGGGSDGGVVDVVDVLVQQSIGSESESESERRKSGNDRDRGGEIRVRHFQAPRLRSAVSVRGTGCALATAIAVALAGGQPLEEAIAGAKSWLSGAIARAVPVGPEWHLG